MLINKSLENLKWKLFPNVQSCRVRTRKLWFWSWSANPLCILKLWCLAKNIVKTFFASKKFFWKWDNLERGLSKILWKFSFIFYGICYQKQKWPRSNSQPFMTLPNTIFRWNGQIVTHPSFNLKVSRSLVTRLSH